MGLEIYGRQPTGRHGKEFLTSRYFWGPLAAYCITVAPDICAPCRYWFSNDGDGLDAAGAIALAKVLQNELASGRVDTYVHQYAFEQELLPDEPCSYCLRPAIQSAPLADGRELKDFRFNCSRCHGSGFCCPVPAFSIGEVCAFIAFLRESGGFEIL